MEIGLMSNSFQCNGYQLTRFWHCFGNHNHMADLQTILNFLQHSRTNVLPINTHRLNGSRDRSGLEIGYMGFSYDTVASHINMSQYTPMLNINLQTTAQAAVDKTKLAYEMTGFPVIKLEVLDETKKFSNQDEIIKATKTLIASDKNLMVCPLFGNDLTTAKKLIDCGAPLLRVMGSGIGSCDGVTAMDTFHQICQLGVPVVLDGGIGSIQDALTALDAGAEGILVNSMLFQQEDTPSDVMKKFAKEFYAYLAKKEALAERSETEFA